LTVLEEQHFNLPSATTPSKQNKVKAFPFKPQEHDLWLTHPLPDTGEQRGRYRATHVLVAWTLGATSRQQKS